MNLHLFTNTLAGNVAPGVETPYRGYEGIEPVPVGEIARATCDRPLKTPIEAMDFDGATYEPDKDQKRLGTLLIRVYNVLKDGQPHTLPELVLKCGGSETGVSSKLRDLRKARFGGHTIEATRKHGGTWTYRLVLEAV